MLICCNYGLSLRLRFFLLPVAGLMCDGKCWLYVGELFVGEIVSTGKETVFDIYLLISYNLVCLGNDIQ